VVIEIRQATRADLDRLIARNPDDAAFERDRFEAQERGESLLLIAWEGDEIRGRLGRLYLASKYDEVRAALGDFPEINALDAWPQGRGVGTLLINAAEEIARARGCDKVGIAVLVDNVAARRLYERLGYEYWGDVLDVSEYRDEAGNVVHLQKDPAVYLVKNIA
jgi:GNAT superfamily N-acetyltransferase